tara:strand:+ start:4081 stop:6831 length:2751 start_codon:yes stop_codon:yes gene_type:complete
MDGKQRAQALIVTGIILLGLNYVALAGFVAGQVEIGVGDTIADGYDSEEDYDDDWNISTSERAYFGYSITNVEELTENSAVNAEFEKMGPFVYEVTTHRELLDLDTEAGTATYSEYDVFEWCETCTWNGTLDGVEGEYASLPGSTEFTNLNILYNTQRLAGIATGIVYGETFAKAGFANQMMAFELQNKAPSIWASEDIDTMVGDFSLGLQAMGMDSVNASILAPSGVLSGAYVAATGGGSQEDILNGTGTFFAYTDSILYDAQDPSTGICIALTCDIGPMLAAGMGAPDGGVVTQTRAALYGYADASTEQMAAIDLGVYALAGNTFQAHGGGADLTTVDDMRERLSEVSGVDISNPQALNNIIFGVEGADIPNGLLSVSDYSGIPLNGVALFLLGAQSDAFGTMTTYGIGLTQLLGLSDWSGAWIGMVGTPFEFPMILLGGSGTMNADLWWQHSFGGEEPLAGGYISIGLNQGEYEGTVDLTVEKVQEILYTSDFALTDDSFSRVFMYNELSGITLPMTAEGPAMGGVVADWDDAYVASLYDISENDAAALRSWVKDFMFENVIGALLGFQYGASPYTTQPIENWLYGWSDPVLLGLYDEESSWVKLETNKTYFGSQNEDRPDGLSTGDYDVYVMSIVNDETLGQRLMQGYTNSNGDGQCDFKLNSDGTIAEPDEDGGYACEEGEIYGMTEHLPWRAPHKEAATYGLLTDNVGNANTVVAGTIGGIADADNSFSVNLVGYSIAQSVPGEMTDFKGISMREHTVDLDPAENQIQAKLIGSNSFVDVLPGALPVYFGSHVDIKVEPTTNVAMYGKSVSRFYLDLRGAGMTNPDFEAGDAKPVFEIHTASEIADEDAETFKCKVLDNMDPMYWTDFGGEGDCELEGTAVIDYVTAVLYIAAIGMIAAGSYMMFSSREE